MKTIAPKDAFKLFLFLLILFSAKAFSFTRLPNESSSGSCESKIGCVKKAANISKTPAKTYATAYTSKGLQSKNNKRFKK